MSDSELIKSSSELAIRQEQRFEQLNLKELGLQPQDFAEVMDAQKELADISTTVVAEYGKNIAIKHQPIQMSCWVWFKTKTLIQQAKSSMKWFRSRSNSILPVF